MFMETLQQIFTLIVDVSAGIQIPRTQNKPKTNKMRVQRSSVLE